MSGYDIFLSLTFAALAIVGLLVHAETSFVIGAIIMSLIVARTSPR